MGYNYCSQRIIVMIVIVGYNVLTVIIMNYMITVSSNGCEDMYIYIDIYNGTIDNLIYWYNMI